MMNPLAAQSAAPPTMQPEQGAQQPGANPLAMQGPQMAPQAAPQAPPDIGAQIGAMNLPPAAIAKHARVASYVANELGALAKNPDVTQKDVVSAAGQAIADGIVDVPTSIKFLSGMPADDKALRPWLANLSMQNLQAAVHLRAMMMQGGMQ